MKLHLGCGGIKLEGYINIDAYQTRAADRVMDVTKLDYSDNSVDEIYSCHMIEHLTKHEAITCLKHCHKCLKPGGLLRLEFPAVDLMVKFWEQDKEALEERFINALYGIQRHPGDYHKYGYTKKSMTKLLNELGFKDTKWEIGRTGYNSNTGYKVWAIKN